MKTDAGKTEKKENLPSKTCVTCGRPFTWRKKWERCWDDVTTCSKSCNAARKRDKRGGENNDDDDDDDDARSASSERSGGGRGDADDAKAKRKDAKKAAKAAARAKRAGNPPVGDDGSKRCDRCETSGQDLLIRCRVDASGRWNMVCGRCWKHVSGGKTDGDAEHPHYAYGGLWKNRRAAKNPTPPPELAGAAAAAAANEKLEERPAAAV